MRQILPSLYFLYVFEDPPFARNDIPVFKTGVFKQAGCIAFSGIDPVRDSGCIRLALKTIDHRFHGARLVGLMLNLSFMALPFHQRRD